MPKPLPRPRPRPGTSSIGKLDVAIARGKLPPAKAALYEAYAVFGDPRLPAAYRGRGSTTQDQDERAMRYVESVFPSLPRSAKAKLRGFFLPPFQKGSWFNTQYLHRGHASAAARGISFEPGWRSINSSVARVWWWSQWEGSAYDEAVARAAADELAGTIWPKEVGLMGRPPVSTPGSDGRLNVVIMPTPHLNPFNPPPTGLTLPFDGTCNKGPRFIQIADRLYAHIVLAHEFFHTLVGAFDHYNCADDEWWDEGTARWVQTYVYPPTDPFFDADAKNYITGAGGPGAFYRELASRANDYPSSAFAYYIAKQFGPEIIRKTWEGAGTQRIANSIDAALGSGGGFNSVWPRFGLQLTNVASPWNDFRTWLGYGESSTTGADTSGTANAADSPVKLGANAGLEDPGVLSLGYRVYDYKITDPATRTVEWWNAWGQPPDGLTIKALYHTPEQGWAQEDWTNQPSRLFCRQMPGGDIDRLVVVIGNSKPYSDPIKPPPGYLPELVSTRAGCKGWGGSVTGSENYNDGSRQYTAGWSIQLHWTASQVDGQGDISYTLDPGATIHYTGLSGTDGDCTLSAPAQDQSVDVSQFSVIYGEPSWSPSSQGSPFGPNYAASASTAQPMWQGAKETCSGQPSDVGLFFPSDEFTSTDPNAIPQIKPVDPSGSTISGSLTYANGGQPHDQVTMSWSLRADGT